MKSIVKKTVCVVMSLFFVFAPAVVDLRQARAQIGLLGELIDLLKDSVEDAELLAKIIAIYNELVKNKKATENQRDLIGELRKYAKDAQEVVSSLEKGYYAVQSLNELRYFEQSIRNYAEFAANNFTKDHRTTSYIVTEGLRKVLQLSNEVSEVVKLLRKQTNQDSATSTSVLQGILRRIREARESFEKLVADQIAEQDPFNSKVSAQAGAELMAVGGMFHAFSYDGKADFASKTIPQLREGDLRKKTMPAAGSASSMSFDEAAIKSAADLVKTDMQRSANSIVNAVRILVGLILIAYTAINLVRQLTGSFEQRFMSPLVRIVFALVVSFVLLGILDVLIR